MRQVCGEIPALVNDSIVHAGAPEHRGQLEPSPVFEGGVDDLWVKLRSALDSALERHSAHCRADAFVIEETHGTLTVVQGKTGSGCDLHLDHAQHQLVATYWHASGRTSRELICSLSPEGQLRGFLPGALVWRVLEDLCLESGLES